MYRPLIFYNRSNYIKRQHVQIKKKMIVEKRFEIVRFMTTAAEEKSGKNEIFLLQ